MSAPERWLADYDRWERERERLSEADGSDKLPHPDEWHRSDDAGVELAERAVDAIKVLDELAGLSGEMWFDLATKLTCREAETLSRLLGVTHSPEMGREFLLAHSDGDDEGDSHFDLRQSEET